MYNSPEKNPCLNIYLAATFSVPHWNIFLHFSIAVSFSVAYVICTFGGL